MDEVILPGAGGHINGTNSSVMGARKRREILSEGFQESTCDSKEAMAEIFGARRYRQDVFRSYKEAEYSSIKKAVKGSCNKCGPSCDCKDCKKKYSEPTGRLGNVPDLKGTLLAGTEWGQQS